MSFEKKDPQLLWEKGWPIIVVDELRKAIEFYSRAETAAKMGSMVPEEDLAEAGQARESAAEFSNFILARL